MAERNVFEALEVVIERRSVWFLLLANDSLLYWRSGAKNRVSAEIATCHDDDVGGGNKAESCLSY